MGLSMDQKQQQKTLSHSPIHFNKEDGHFDREGTGNTKTDELGVEREKHEKCSLCQFVECPSFHISNVVGLAETLLGLLQSLQFLVTLP